MEIVHYNSDSGNRDLKELSYPLTYTFIEILNIAYENKAPLIVKTSYKSEAKPGAWYIKGNEDSNYENIKNRIEENILNGNHTKRECYLIKYL
jgi:uncharacterized membrane protein